MVTAALVVGGMVTAVPAFAATLLTASPTSVNFPNTAVGSSSAAVDVVITNGAATANTITSVSLTGSDPGAFQIDTPNDTCLAATLAAAGKCTVPVLFVPLAPGPVTAILHITDPGAGTPLDVLLGGTGEAVPQIAFSPTSLGFGAVGVNQISANVPLQVTNPGGGATTITNVTLTGSNASEFNVVSDGCIGTSITNPGVPCFLLVNFAPNQGGPASAQLNFFDNAAGSPQVVPLGGTGNGATLALSANPLAFGNVPVGTTSLPMTETLTNTGNVTLTVTSIVLAGPNVTDFVGHAASSTCALLPVIPAGGSCTDVFTFTPTIAGAESAQNLFIGNFSNSPVALNFSGTGTVTPAIQFAPPSIAYGNVTLGTTANGTVTATNVGNGLLAITNVTLSGLNVNQFTIVNDTCLGASLPNGGSCQVTVAFAPNLPGTLVAQINFTDNAAGSPQSVPLGGNGSGGFLVITPSTLNFPTTQIGATSAPITVTLSDTGDAPLTITSDLLSGPNGADFPNAVGGTCAAVLPITITAGGSCTELIVFKPTIIGAETATASLVGNFFNSPATFTANGTGAGAPAIAFAPPSLAFGNQAVDSTSAPLTVQVSNPGNAPTLITSVTLGGANPSSFTITKNTCNGATLPPNCAVTVVFNPQAGGSLTATLVFNDNVAGSPQNVVLGGTGSGPGMSVSPTSLAFGNVPVGTSSAPQSVTVTDTGSASLVLAAPTLAAPIPLPAEFTVSGALSTCVAGVAGALTPGTSCTWVVLFNPTVTGAASATLEVGSNAANSPIGVTLTGNGTGAPAVTIAPNPLSFPAQAVGTTSSPSAASVTNTGNAPLIITSDGLGGANPGDFVVVSDGCANATVAPAAKCTVIFEFAPTAINARNATFTFNDNAADTPQTLALNGIGLAAPMVVVSPSSINFGPVPQNTVSPLVTVTVTNTGGALVTFSASGPTITGQNAADFFAHPGTCGSTLAAGASCTLTVNFAPGTTSLELATLNVNDNAPNSPQTVALSGTGTAAPAVVFNPTSLNFGTHPVGVFAGPLTDTITNGGNAPLVITSDVIVGTNKGDFTVTADTCVNQTIAAGSSCTVSVAFTAGASGARTATFDFVDNAPGSPQALPLTGAGALPAIQFNPTSISFPNTNIGNQSAGVLETVTNIGATTLTITNVVASAQFGDNADTCIGASLAAGATCTLNVFFLPTASGPQTGTLTFTDNAGGVAGATQTVPLGGTGNSGIPGFNASPLSIAFGNQTVGTTSAPLSVNITNPGSAPLIITNVALTGTNPGDFTISSDPCVGAVVTIAPGASCTVQVTFTPTAGGSRTANLVFTDNAPTSPQTVSLGGNGIVPPATSILSPTIATLTVSSVGASTTQTFTVQNNPASTGNLGFGTPVATTTNAVFSVTGGTCTPATSLAPGASCTIIVTFTSTSTVTATGTLNVNDLSGGLPANAETAALSGVVSTAPPPPVCGTGTNINSPLITPSNLSFGSVSVGITSNPQVVTVENMDPSHQLCVTGITTSLPLVFGILTPPTNCLNTPLNFLQSCQIDVTFTPNAKIGYFQSLSITDNANNSPQVVTLSGQGM